MKKNSEGFMFHLFCLVLVFEISLQTIVVLASFNKVCLSLSPQKVNRQTAIKAKYLYIRPQLHLLAGITFLGVALIL